MIYIIGNLYFALKFGEKKQKKRALCHDLGAKLELCATTQSKLSKNSAQDE
ncbi:MAG: hypothetical protein IAA81_00310 [Spirochaetes bacterium]|uniref:Uncharacterized protein n=1 Tax=Candidatus Gallitreponema excrementavium TaxID=2840840 RepID=A0A9D9HMX4_9SPIR|nr:hypothetical protein [Candidatus Gallitreponema excrementavium]